MAPPSACSSPYPRSFTAPATVLKTSESQPKLACYCLELFLTIFSPLKNYKSWPPFSWQTCQGLKNVLHRCDRAMIYVFIAGSYFPWLTLENTNHSMLLFCMEWIIWLMAAIGIAYQQVSWP